MLGAASTHYSDTEEEDVPGFLKVRHLQQFCPFVQRDHVWTLLSAVCSYILSKTLHKGYFMQQVSLCFLPLIWVKSWCPLWVVIQSVCVCVCVVSDLNVGFRLTCCTCLSSFIHSGQVFLYKLVSVIDLCAVVSVIDQFRAVSLSVLHKGYFRNWTVISVIDLFLLVIDLCRVISVIDLCRVISVGDMFYSFVFLWYISVNLFQWLIYTELF